jgi:hypothetical protein
VKYLGIVALGISALALCCPSIASAKPVGTISCTGATTQVKFNVSLFDFGVANATSIGSGSSGAGAGKVTFKPLELHAALSTFASLVDAAANGVEFRSCTLSTTLNDGAQAEFEFRTLRITSLTAEASMPAQANEPARFTDVQFEYAAVEVKTAGGSDDGGSTVSTGWNVGANQSN